MFYKIGLFKNFGKLTRKRLCQSFFLIKLYTSKPATLLKRYFSSDVLISRNCFKHLFYSSGFSILFNLLNPLPCGGCISIFSKHYLVLDISKPLLFLVEARNHSISFYTKVWVKQALFLKSFPAAQQTSTAKLPAFF